MDGVHLLIRIHSNPFLAQRAGYRDIDRINLGNPAPFDSTLLTTPILLNRLHQPSERNINIDDEEGRDFRSGCVLMSPIPCPDRDHVASQSLIA